MARIHIDQGHGYPDNRGGVLGLNEGENNFYLGNDIGKALERLGHTVTYTRSDIHQFTGKNENLDYRRSLGAGKDLFLSTHTNAINGSVSGVEMYDSFSAPDILLAKKLAEVSSKALGIPNRGVRYRGDNSSWDISYTPVKGKTDYYAVLRGNKAKHAILAEFFYHDHVGDVTKYRANRDRLISAVANAIDEHLRYKLGENTDLDILSKPTCTVEMMKAYAKAKNAHTTFIELAQTFYDVSVRYGVDPCITYAQSGKETAFFNFGGVLDLSFKNPCGMKTTEGGGDYDKNAHKRFDTWEQGITAQVEHLALYAGHKEAPFPNAVDPRHFPYIKGKAKTVRQLGGNWAPSAVYGEDVLRRTKEIWTYGKVNLGDAKPMEKGNMNSIITYVPHAEKFAKELSKKLRIPMLEYTIPFDYYGIEKVIGVGENRYKSSMTGYLTHFVNARDNWSKQRNDDFMDSAVANIDRFKEVK